MKILIINGSPKGERSNSLRLTRKFVEGFCEGVMESGRDAPEGEIVTVAEKNILPCRGCFSCWAKTPGKCVLRDDMAGILEKITAADVLIWSFPLYFFGLPGPMKNLIDRQLPLSQPFMLRETESGGHPARVDLSGQKRIAVSTCGFYTAKGNYTGVIDLLNRLCGKDGCTRIFCGQGELFRVPQLSERTDAYLEDVREAGREYAKTGAISPGMQERLDEPLYPREIYEKMADASWGVSTAGEKEDDAFVFTKQMAALYNPVTAPDHDIVIEMDYTDIGRRCQMILGPEGSRVTEDLSAPYTTLIHTPLSVWKEIGAGKITGPEAMMKHLFSIEGSFDTMLHWDDYFAPFNEKQSEGEEQDPGSGEISAHGARELHADSGEIPVQGCGKQHADPVRKNPAVSSAHSGKTSMLALLIAPIVFWSAGPFSGRWGGFAAVAASALTLLIFYRNRWTLYDVLSAAGTSILGASLMLGADPSAMIALSYALFGLMWLISCFRKIPLTAEYSLNQYGGKKMLGNVLFLKTNQILTLGWALVFFADALLKVLLDTPEHFVFMEVLSYGLMAAMGVFTAWFQRWYPQHVARG